MDACKLAYNHLLINQKAIAGLLERIVLKFLSFVSKNLILAIPAMMLLGFGFGLLAPTGTPREIVARVNADVGKALQLPEVQDKLKGLGMQIVGGPPEQFSGFMRAEAIKWGKIVKDSGAKVD